MGMFSFWYYSPPQSRSRNVAYQCALTRLNALEKPFRIFRAVKQILDIIPTLQEAEAARQQQVQHLPVLREQGLQKSKSPPFSRLTHL